MTLYDQIRFTKLNKDHVMQALKLLHKVLEESSVIGHEKRLNCLMRSVEGVLHDGKLSLSHIGRHLKGTIKVKNKIKSVDNLLSNTKLMTERKAIYSAVSATLLRGCKEIYVIVDWSSCESHEQHILKASVVMQGRSITLYEEVHPEKQLGKQAIHRAFLGKLKEIIPSGIDVVIITDAGFRTEWFEMVVELGWNYIGRIISNMTFQYEGKSEWEPCFSVHSQATGKPRFLGNVLLAKTRQIPGSLYLYHDKKRKKKATQKKRRKNSSGKMEKSYAKANREPWLLATSLPGGQEISAKMIIKYRYRMRIEHEFRDTKNTRWGIGLENSKTKDIERLQILLLIGYLAIFALWLIGLAAERQKIHYDYQANTIKDRRVLSLVFLGLQIILHEPNRITQVDLIHALKEAREI
jgi:hypothetical protein